MDCIDIINTNGTQHAVSGLGNTRDVPDNRCHGNGRFCKYSPIEDDFITAEQSELLRLTPRQSEII